MTSNCVMCITLNNCGFDNTLKESCALEILIITSEIENIGPLARKI
jgi:hypothetical protein